MLSKLKQLTKETALYGISTILGRFLNFLLIPLYTNLFSEADVGIYGTVYSYIAFFQLVMIYGMDVAYLKYASGLEKEKLRSVFGTVFNTIVISSLVILGIAFLFANPLAEFIDLKGEYSYLVYSVILILFFDTLTNIPFVHLRLKRKPLRFAVIRTLNICLNLSLNIILIIGYDFGIEAIFYSNLVASILNLILLLPVIFENYQFSLNLDSLKQLLKFGLPYLPASVAIMMIRVLDRPILNQMVDADAVGIYVANYKLGIFMMLFVAMFQYAWQPFFLDNSKEADAKEMFGRILTYFLIVGSFILVGLSLFINDIVQFELPGGKHLIGETFWSGTAIVPVVLLGYLFNGMYVNFTVGIFIEEKTRYMPFITALGAVTNIVTNLLLIPQIGIMGAAVAMLASYFIMTIAIFVVSQKFYRIPYEYLKIAGIFASVAIVGFLYYYGESLQVITASHKIGLLVLFTGLLFGLRVVNLRELKTIINLFVKRK